MSSYSYLVTFVSVILIAFLFDILCAERIYSTEKPRNAPNINDQNAFPTLGEANRRHSERRDFVNQPPKPPTPQPQPGPQKGPNLDHLLLSYPGVPQQQPPQNSGQTTGGRRDFVNPNPRSPSPPVGANTNLQSLSYPSPPPQNQPAPNVNKQASTTNTQNQSGGRRDWVNPGPKSPSPTPQVPPPSNAQPQPNENQSQQTGGRRDWVNPGPRSPSPQPSPTAPTPPQAPQNQGQQAGGRRDWVNPAPRSPSPQPNQQKTNVQSPIVPQSPTATENRGQHSGGRRDFVNPILQNQGTSTTPWPQLGPKQGQPPVSGITPPPPTWVKPSNPQGPPGAPGNQPNKQPVNLSDILKMPSHKPGWDTPIGSTISKTPSVGPTPSPTTPSTLSAQELAEEKELKEFSESLLKKDVNNAAKYVTINLQGKTSSRSTDDKAPQPLLSIKQEAYNLPTVSKLVPLHNNYILDTKESEYATPQEKAEENALLDAMLSTPIMQLTRNFLISKGKISKDPKDFRDLLKQIWFNMYSRGGGKINSSGFEHVFLAELKNKEVFGLHNWIYFNDQESKNKANYLGYLRNVDLGDKGAIIKYHFTFSNLDKPVGSMFVGTSPELEIALYSTCFLLKPDKACPVKLNGHDFIIRTYTFRYRGKNMIGSAYPEI